MRESEKSKTVLLKENQQLRAELEAFKLKHETCEFRLNNVTQEHIILRKIIDNNPLSIQIVNADGSNRSVNAAHTELFKAIPDESFNLFTDPQLLEQGLEPLLKKLRQGETVNFPDNMYNPHLRNPAFPNIEVYTHGVAFAVVDSDENPIQYIVMHVNITERIRDIQKIQDLNEQLQELNKYLDDAIEKEREYISHELHDDLGPTLAYIMWEVHRLGVKYKIPEMVAEIDKIIVQIQEINDKIRNLSTALFPQTIKSLGIIEAIRTLMQTFEEHTNIKVGFAAVADLQIPDSITTPLYRIFQGAISNIAKHSHAKQAEVSLTKNKNHLQINISDNGIGIDNDPTQKKSGHGINIMKNRVRRLGGSLLIECPEGRGTHIVITIPLNNTEV